MFRSSPPTVYWAFAMRLANDNHPIESMPLHIHVCVSVSFGLYVVSEMVRVGYFRLLLVVCALSSFNLVASYSQSIVHLIINK